jgi:ATP-binding cassette subfamily B (MDR/TAP) protein 1
MSADKDIPDTPERRTSDDVKKSPTPTASDGATGEPNGGMGGYVVSMLNRARETPRVTLYQRIFKYADRTSWTLNVIAFIAAVAAGTLLPLM